MLMYLHSSSVVVCRIIHKMDTMITKRIRRAGVSIDPGGVLDPGKIQFIEVVEQYLGIFVCTCVHRRLASWS